MKQAMIFAAGLGTRLKPLTDTKPKALVEVGGKPLLEHIIEKLKAEGFERIIINIHHFGQQIIDYLKNNNYFGIDIRISDESQQLLETGGGIKKAQYLFDSNTPVLIHNVDILSNANLKSFYEKTDSEAALLVSNRDTSRYLLFDDEMRLAGWTNIKTGEIRSPYKDFDITKHKAFAFSGIHAFSPKLFNEMGSYPDRFGIIDFYLDQCAKHVIKGIIDNNLQLIDVGKLNTLELAEKWIGQKQ